METFYLQTISARKQALCQLCVLSFRVEVTEEKDTKLCHANDIQKESNKVTV